MKVQIVATKKVPGPKRVEWPEVPEWVWGQARSLRFGYVYVTVHLAGYNIGFGVVACLLNTATNRVYNTNTREVVVENITDGPWVIQEPDREVPLTAEELMEKFPESEWLLMGIRGQDFWCVDLRSLMTTYRTWPGPLKITIIALNRHTFETVKIAEVVE